MGFHNQFQGVFFCGKIQIKKGFWPKLTSCSFLFLNAHCMNGQFVTKFWQLGYAVRVVFWCVILIPFKIGTQIWAGTKQKIKYYHTRVLENIYKAIGPNEGQKCLKIISRQKNSFERPFLLLFRHMIKNIDLYQNDSWDASVNYQYVPFF